MPTSKNRSGKSSRTFSSLFPWHIAAVMTATFGSSCIASWIAALTASVYAFAPPFLSDTIVRSGPTFSKTGGVWNVTGSSAACGDAVPLFGEHVQQDRALLRLQVAEDLAQAGQVVAVDRADVAEAELLEEHAAREERLEPVADLLERRLGHARRRRGSR